MTSSQVKTSSAGMRAGSARYGAYASKSRCMDRRQDLAHELLVPGRLIDPQHGAGDHRRLDRRGIEGIGECDRVLAKRRVVRALLPEEHVRDEAIGPSALHQAADFLFSELRID